MTLEQAKSLCVGDTIYHVLASNCKGERCAVKITRIKVWKTRPNEIEIHWKYGLYEYDTIREYQLDAWTLEPIYDEHRITVVGHFILAPDGTATLWFGSGDIAWRTSFKSKVQAKRYITKHFGRQRWIWVNACERSI